MPTLCKQLLLIQSDSVLTCPARWGRAYAGLALAVSTPSALTCPGATRTHIISTFTFFFCPVFCLYIALRRITLFAYSEFEYESLSTFAYGCLEYMGICLCTYVVPIETLGSAHLKGDSPRSIRG